MVQALDLPGLTDELRRHADDVDRTRRAPVEGLAALRARGLFGPLVPEADGGLDLSPVELFDVAIAIGAGCGATGLIWGQHLAATAMIATWGAGDTRTVLPGAARGERLFGIGVGHTAKGTGAVLAHWQGDRAFISGAAPWVTGATLMTDALIGAEDRERGGVILSIVPAASLVIGEPYGLNVVTSGMTATVSFEHVEVTESMLNAPRDRTAHGAVFTANKSPRDSGFYAGLTRAALGLCRDVRNLDEAVRDNLARVERQAEAAEAAMREWLLGRTFEEIDQPAFWTRYHRTAAVVTQAAALAMSAGGSGALRDGATHNRLAREAMYYIARIPLRSWAAETARHLESTA